jgi:hypothetical protein
MSMIFLYIHIIEILYTELMKNLKKNVSDIMIVK